MTSFKYYRKNDIEKKLEKARFMPLDVMVTGVTIRKPVYYSAEYSYNVEKLLDFIIDNIILERRQLIGA